MFCSDLILSDEFEIVNGFFYFLGADGGNNAAARAWLDPPRARLYPFA